MSPNEFAVRIRRGTDDPFFAEGDILAWNDGSTLAYFYKENEESHLRQTLNNNDDNFSPYHDPFYSFSCAAPGCNQIFNSHLECENHYRVSHEWECSECGMVFRNGHCLDLHIEERHDTFFALSIEKEKAFYRCLEQDCPSKFSSDAERNLHLRTVHQYPKWFRFYPKIKEEDIILMQKEREKKRYWLGKKTSRHDRMTGSSCQQEKKEENCRFDESIQTKTKDSDQDENKTISVKRRRRKERQMKLRASIPCRFFFTKGGCYRGHACVFSHETIVDQNECMDCEQESNISSKDNHILKNGDNMDTDVHHEMYEPNNGFISIPSKITFGRGLR